MALEKRITVRLPEDVAEMIEKRMETADISQNEMVVRALRYAFVAKGVKYKKVVEYTL
jgi:hypothetical protein